MKKIALLFLFFGVSVQANNFWKPFGKVLKEGVVYYRYSSIDGDFYHTAVDYAKIKNNNSLIELLKKQRQDLINYKLSTNFLNENLAFWINAYNFFTIVDVVSRYPVKSMRSDIGWKNTHHIIGGKNFSLDMIEHKIIRKYNDARIHFAINCASVGCPALISDIFVKDNLNKQLEEVTINALLNPLHLYKHPSKNRYYHTKLFDWFDDDFEKAPYKSVSSFINKFAPKKYSGISSTRSISYDWDLNNPQNIKAKMQGVQSKYSELKIISK